MTTPNHPTGPHPAVASANGHADTVAMPSLMARPTGPHPVVNEERRPTSPQPLIPAEAFTTPPNPKPHVIPFESILEALEHAIWVVKPDETLVIRVPGWLNRQQVVGYQRSVDELVAYHGVPNHILILPGEEFAKIAGRPAEPAEQDSPAGPPSGPQHVLRDPR